MHRAVPSTGPRTAAALAAVLVLLAVGLSPSRARADVAQVTVVSPGGAEQTLALSALAGGEDVAARPYVLRSDSGETHPGRNRVLAGQADRSGRRRPLRLLLPRGAAPRRWHRPAQPRAGARRRRLRRRAAGRLRDRDRDRLPAAERRQRRPQRRATPSTRRRGSRSCCAKGWRCGSGPRHRRIKARPGQKVEFSAIVERAGSGEQLTYSWNFDDGHSGSGANASHSFAKRGSYDVVVGVTSGGNEAGASAVITIQVGEPLGGPDRKGGGTNRRADAPDHGSAAGPSTGPKRLGSRRRRGLGPQPPTPNPSPTPTPAAACRPEGDKCRPQRQAGARPGRGQRRTAERFGDAAPSPSSSAAARTGSLDGGGESGLALSTTAGGRARDARLARPRRAARGAAA